MLLGILLIRTSPLYLAFGVFIGIMNYRSTERFRQVTGKNPWGIPPIAWGLASIFVSLIVTVLALVAMSTGRNRNMRSGLVNGRGTPPAPSESYPGLPRPTGPPGAPPAAIHLTGATVVSAPPSWQPDPSGRFDFRYWSGDEWTEFVSKSGITSHDPV